MKPLNERARPPARISLTPLIGVVFILLVFFMLATNFFDWRGITLASAGGGGGDPLRGARLIELTAQGAGVGGVPMRLPALRAAAARWHDRNADTHIPCAAAAGRGHPRAGGAARNPRRRGGRQWNAAGARAMSLPPLRRRTVLTRPRADADAETRILPLINILFLLLIFFMVAGTLDASDPFEVAPATSARAGTPPPDGTEVLMGRNGRLALNEAGMDEAALLGRIKAQAMASPDLVLRLRADGAVPAPDLAALLGRLRGVGAGRIILMTLPEGHDVGHGDALPCAGTDAEYVVRSRPAGGAGAASGGFGGHVPYTFQKRQQRRGRRRTDRRSGAHGRPPRRRGDGGSPPAKTVAPSPAPATEPDSMTPPPKRPGPHGGARSDAKRAARGRQNSTPRGGHCQATPRNRDCVTARACCRSRSRQRGRHAAAHDRDRGTGAPGNRPHRNPRRPRTVRWGAGSGPSGDARFDSDRCATGGRENPRGRHDGAPGPRYAARGTGSRAARQGGCGGSRARDGVISPGRNGPRRAARAGRDGGRRATERAADRLPALGSQPGSRATNAIHAPRRAAGSRGAARSGSA